jgi:Uma2 family endonuclease
MSLVIESTGLTVVDLAERFGPIAIDRIVMQPAPGQATEDDAIKLTERKIRICELVDGVLVEKVMGAYESLVAANLIRLIGSFVASRKLGSVLGEAGMLRLAPGLIRIPDVAFLSKDKFPGGRFPRDAAWSLAPDLAVEVLSKGNTDKEMTEKLHDYFNAGTRLVWYVDPSKRQVQAFTSPSSSHIVGQGQTLDGGDVLPGFELSLKELFAELPEA